MSLRIGDTAPDFKAETTEGPINFHEWLGSSWGVLFSHPKDFTPVCTTELGYMAKLKPEFDKRNTKIIGLSVDPVSDHTRWVKDIEETQGSAVSYPLIGDSDLAVAKLYDMGKIAGAVVGARREPHAVEKPRGLVQPAAFRDGRSPESPDRALPGLHRERHVLQRGEPREHARHLERARDARGHAPMHRDPRDVASLERDRARVGQQRAGDLVDERALARAVGTDDGVDFAFIDVEIEAIARGHAAEALD